VARRNTAFARVYDIPERVLPAAVLNLPTPTPEDAMRQLAGQAARSLGVATEVDIRDYFRMPVEGARRAVAELVEAGEILPVSIPGWPRQAYLHREAKIPRAVRAATLISPFDPLVWHRDRAQRLFDFLYRIEIYVPAAQRLYGYYVLPFLLGDRLVARVDLKADRATSTLRIPAAWVEPGAPPDTAVQLAKELHRLAGWLGLAEIEHPERGDFASRLSAALIATDPADVAESGAGVP
jgi:uncharacterized protein YcaQ